MVRRFDCGSLSSNIDDTYLVCRRKFLACGEPVARNVFFAEARFRLDGPGCSLAGLELKAAATESTSDRDNPGSSSIGVPGVPGVSWASLSKTLPADEIVEDMEEVVELLEQE